MSEHKTTHLLSVTASPAHRVAEVPGLDPSCLIRVTASRQFITRSHKETNKWPSTLSTYSWQRVKSQKNHRTVGGSREEHPKQKWESNPQPSHRVRCQCCWPLQHNVATQKNCRKDKNKLWAFVDIELKLNCWGHILQVICVFLNVYTFQPNLVQACMDFLGLTRRQYAHLQFKEFCLCLFSAARSFYVL